MDSKVNNVINQIESLIDQATYTENTSVTYDLSKCDEEVSNEVKLVLTDHGYTVSGNTISW